MLSKFEKRANDIINNLTLKEKIGQLNQVATLNLEKDLDKFKEEIRKGNVGSIILANSATAGIDRQSKIDVSIYNELQRIAVEESPSHIPLIYGRDVIHGHRTVYPVPIATAAAFNPELVTKCYSNIAKEATNDSVHWTFSPMIDMSRDPRWGRLVEGPGEDPFVGAEFAKAAVKGFQGDDYSAPDKMVACAKHYIGYGASESGVDYKRTEISDYSLYNYYLPAFKAAVDAGIGTVMSSFNDINGQPVTSSKKYLTDILRGKLGFEGFVISDWSAIYQLTIQGVVDNKKDSAELAINAGLDMDMYDGCYTDYLEELVSEGKVSEETINESVKRVLLVKMALGLFENPYCNQVKLDRTEHIADSRKLASECMVLLKNEGNVLPLDKNKKIGVAGPFLYERRALLGTWTLDGEEDETPNFYEAMSEKLGGNLVSYRMPNTSYNDLTHIAYNSDVLVLALGESHMVTGEMHSLADISLTSEQVELVKKAKAVGKKVVGVIFCARPVALQCVAEYFDAILYAWHSGTETAHAAADILFGDTVPSGKTAVTFPRVTGQIPIYYNVTSCARPRNGYYGQTPHVCYDDVLGSPMYPFGFGLSYTEFKYSEPHVNKNEISIEDIKNGESFKVSVKVENVGNFDGKEIVQLYIHDKVAKMMRPLRELKGFSKPLIKKGESAEVEFELGFDKLGYYLENGEYTLEKGEFEVFVGENCLTNNKVLISVK